MKIAEEYTVIAPGGGTSRVTLFLAPDHSEPIPAPQGLLEHLGVGRGDARWFLLPLYPGNTTGMSSPATSGNNYVRRTLCLVRSTVAGAGRIPFDPRQTRLRKERLRLRQLVEESDFVRVDELNVIEGSEPENYRVTFLVKGIIGIDSSQRPIYGHNHQVEILCDEDFPSDVPRLRWITPIWHPNIQHAGDKGVCVNKPEWLGGMGLVDLCRLMFEMVQYKNYHAEYTQPYPLDQLVARWVLDHAEPNGIVDKRRGISVDDKPFTRPTVTRYISMAPAPPAPEGRIKVITSVQHSQPSNPRIKIVDSGSPSAAGPKAEPNPSRIRLVNNNE